MSAGDREIVPVDDLKSLGEEAARRFAEQAQRAVADHGEFRVALSGGSTPRALYSALASPAYRAHIPWDRMQVFFSDERFVPPDSDQSNYHTAQTGLFDLVPIPERQIHRYATVDIEPDESAELYAEGLRRVFHADLVTVPRFDLIFLGMGPDGHTASLFPDTEALHERNRLVVPNFVPKMDSWRLTFTFPLLDAGAMILFMVAGDDKRDALARVLSGNSDLPAERVAQSAGHVAWLVERALLPAGGA